MLRSTVILSAFSAVFSQSNSSSTSSSWTTNEIADYQVALWTSILLGSILVGTIYFMLGMDEKKDPQLYAQLIDSRAGSKSSSR